jgi:hypothetical protein
MVRPGATVGERLGDLVHGYPQREWLCVLLNQASSAVNYRGSGGLEGIKSSCFCATSVSLSSDVTLGT